MEEEKEDSFMPLGLSPYAEEEIISNNTVTYFVKSFSEFSQKLKEQEVRTNSKFVLAHSLKKFTAECVGIRENSKLRWKDDIPYYHVCTRTYTCHQGRDGNIYQKKKYAQHRDAKALTDHNCTKRYNKVQLTKKLDCPAIVNVSRIIWIPEHKLVGNLTKTFEKKKMSRMIKSKICRGEPVGEECYMFNLPDETDHMYHVIGADTELVSPIYSETGDSIGSLVQESENDDSVPSNISADNVLKTTEKQNETSDSRGSRIRLLNSCMSSMRSIKSTMSYLDENTLEKLSKTLKVLFSKMTREAEKSTELPIEYHIPASSSEEYRILQSCKQEVNERVVAADDMINRSQNLEINKESIKETNQRKRQLVMKQEVNETVVVEDDMINRSQKIEIDQESKVETNNLKRKKRPAVILIKKIKYNPQLSLFHTNSTNTISIPTKQSITS